MLPSPGGCSSGRSVVHALRCRRLLSCAQLLPPPPAQCGIVLPTAAITCAAAAARHEMQVNALLPYLVRALGSIPDTVEGESRVSTKACAAGVALRGLTLQAGATWLVLPIMPSSS
jgi:hypothetical protein